MAKQFDLFGIRFPNLKAISITSIYDFFLAGDNDMREIKKQIIWYASVVGLFTALLFAFILSFSTNRLDFFVALFASGVALLALILLKRNMVDPAISVLIAGALVATWVACFAQGGLYDVGIHTLYPIIILVFVLQPWKRRLLFSLLIIASILTLMLLESQGVYQNLGDPYAPVITGVDIVSSAALAMLLMGFVIHKLERVNQKLEHTTDELQMLIAKKDLLLEMLTHDMKSPLTAIGLYSEKIKRDPSIVQQQPQIADNLLKSLQALSGLVDNIVDNEQLKKTGRLSVKHEVFNLLETLEDSIHFMEAQAREKGISFLIVHSIITGKGIAIEGDQGQLRRAVTNLLSNAVKYSPDNTQVLIEVSETDKDVRFSVIDQGYGISATELPTIFDLYGRATAYMQNIGGNGIGLAIVKSIVEQHGGQISVESEVSKGSCFCVTLPKPT